MAFYLPNASKKTKRPIVALVERGGNVSTFHVPVADKVNVQKMVKETSPAKLSGRAHAVDPLITSNRVVEL